MYRPKDWASGAEIYDTEKKGGISDAEMFEAGADAMLKGLREGATQVSNLGELPQGKGVVVFIPDES